MKKICSQCNNFFECLEDTICWCASIPKLKKEWIDPNDCLCNNCLLQRYRNKLIGT